MDINLSMILHGSNKPLMVKYLKAMDIISSMPRKLVSLDIKEIQPMCSNLEILMRQILFSVKEEANLKNQMKFIKLQNPSSQTVTI